MEKQWGRKQPSSPGAGGDTQSPEPSSQPGLKFNSAPVRKPWCAEHATFPPCRWGARRHPGEAPGRAAERGARNGGPATAPRERPGPAAPLGGESGPGPERTKGGRRPGRALREEPSAEGFSPQLSQLNGAEWPVRARRRSPRSAINPAGRGSALPAGSGAGGGCTGSPRDTAEPPAALGRQCALESGCLRPG